MNRPDLEELVRRCLAAGLSMVVVLVAPGTGGDAPPDPPAVSASPRAAEHDARGSTDADETSDDRAPREDGRTEDAGPSAGEATSAADRHGWGRPNRVDHFTDGLGPDWNVYDGPGHAGNGRRSPSAVSVEDGVLTITGSRSGTTAGMSWNPGQEHGRWEGRVRAPAASDSYHALMLLWPDAEDFPVGGEIDFMELLGGDRQETDFFLHYGPDNEQVHGEVEVDATRWHNWAVQWTPRAITAYLDGEEWFRTTDTATFPPGPMHLAIQLDWFPDDGPTRTSVLQVDWVKQYPLDDR